MNYDRICKDILNLDKKIRFAAICDDAGETRYGGMREGMSSLLTPEETRKSVQLAIGRWGLRDALTQRLVRLNMQWLNMKRLNVCLSH